MPAGDTVLLLVNGQPSGIALGMADTFWSRFWGLMGRRALRGGQGLLIRPCASVHTIGMRFAIDIAFLAADGTVLTVACGVQPMRAVRCRGARQVVELRSGLIRALGLTPGDIVQMVPVCHNTD